MQVVIAGSHGFIGGRARPPPAARAVTTSASWCAARRAAPTRSPGTRTRDGSTRGARRRRRRDQPRGRQPRLPTADDGPQAGGPLVPARTPRACSPGRSPRLRRRPAGAAPGVRDRRVRLPRRRRARRGRADRHHVLRRASCASGRRRPRPRRTPGVRVVHLRTGIVLGPGGGALGRLLPLMRLGVGGRLGSGRQFWPWITLLDEVRAIEHLLTAPVHGPGQPGDRPGAQRRGGRRARPRDAPARGRARARRSRCVPCSATSRRRCSGSIRAVPARAGRRAASCPAHADLATAAEWVAHARLTSPLDDVPDPPPVVGPAQPEHDRARLGRRHLRPRLRRRRAPGSARTSPTSRRRPSCRRGCRRPRRAARPARRPRARRRARRRGRRAAARPPRAPGPSATSTSASRAGVARSPIDLVPRSLAQLDGGLRPGRRPRCGRPASGAAEEAPAARHQRPAPRRRRTAHGARATADARRRRRCPVLPAGRGRRPRAAPVAGHGRQRRATPARPASGSRTGSGSVGAKHASTTSVGVEPGHGAAARSSAVAQAPRRRAWSETRCTSAPGSWASTVATRAAHVRLGVAGAGQRAAQVGQRPAGRRAGPRSSTRSRRRARGPRRAAPRARRPPGSRPWRPRRRPAAPARRGSARATSPSTCSTTSPSRPDDSSTTSRTCGEVLVPDARTAGRPARPSRRRRRPGPRAARAGGRSRRAPRRASPRPGRPRRGGTRRPARAVSTSVGTTNRVHRGHPSRRRRERRRRSSTAPVRAARTTRCSAAEQQRGVEHPGGAGGVGRVDRRRAAVDDPPHDRAVEVDVPAGRPRHRRAGRAPRTSQPSCTGSPGRRVSS